MRNTKYLVSTTHTMHDAHTFDRNTEYPYAKIYNIHTHKQIHWQFSAVPTPFHRDEITFRNFFIAFERKHYWLNLILCNSFEAHRRNVSFVIALSTRSNIWNIVLQIYAKNMNNIYQSWRNSHKGYKSHIYHGNFVIHCVVQA